MGSERPLFLYGRYYYGQEVVGNINDLQPLNENNAQYNRTEITGYNRHIYHVNLTRDSQPADSFGSRYHDFSRPAIDGGIGTSRNDYGEVYASGPSSESNTRTYHGYGNLQPVNSFGSRHQDFRGPAIHGGIGASRNDYGEVYASGPSSESNTRTYHGYGNLQPVNSFGSRHQDFRGPALHGGIGASRNDYNEIYAPGPSSESNTRTYHGYENPQPADLFGSRHHAVNRPTIHERGHSIRGYDNVSYNQGGPSDRHPSSSGSSMQSATTDHEQVNHSKKALDSQHKGNNNIYEDVNFLSNENYIDSLYTCENASDVTSFANLERSKLMNRIKKYFQDLTPLIFSKNCDLFDKPDWVKVSFISCNGMKIYHAEMICPICFGKLTPQNKEKEAGRVPKWELGMVKRHVINKHLRKNVIQGEEEGVNNVRLSIEKQEKYIEKNVSSEATSALFEKKEEDIEKIEPFEVKIQPPSEDRVEPSEKIIQLPSEDTIEPLHGKKELLVDKAKLSDHEMEDTLFDDTSDFPSDLSIASSVSISDSNSHLDSESGNIDSDKPVKIAKNKRKLSESKNERKPPGRKRRKLEMPSSSSESEHDSPDTDKREKIAKNKRKSSGNQKRRRKLEKPSKSSKSSESEHDSLDIPIWKKPGVTFGWVKFTQTSRFQPAFIFPKLKNSKQMAQYIQSKGKLSPKHPIEVIATPAEVEQANNTKKSYTHVVAIKKFNDLNNTKF